MRILMMLLLMLLVSCGTPQFHETKVEKWSYDAIDHKQKVEVGMTKAELFSKFGVPDRVQNIVLFNDYRIEVEYLYKIWCSYPSCRVYIDPVSGLVTSFVNFRFEYTKDLK